MILKAGDAAIVAVERPHEFAGGSVPDFDGSIAGRRHDVLLVEVDDVDGRAVADQHSAEIDLCGRDHVPDGDRSVLGTGDHDSVVESQVLPEDK